MTEAVEQQERLSGSAGISKSWAWDGLVSDLRKLLPVCEDVELTLRLPPSIASVLLVALILCLL